MSIKQLVDFIFAMIFAAGIACVVQATFANLLGSFGVFLLVTAICAWP